MLLTLHFVCLAFIVFRVTELQDIALVFQAIFRPDLPWASWPDASTLIALALLAAAWLLQGALAAGFAAFARTMQSLPAWAWPLPAAAVMCALVVVAPPGIPAFIYAAF